MSVTELSGEKRSPDDDASVSNSAKRQKLAGIMKVIFSSINLHLEQNCAHFSADYYLFSKPISKIIAQLKANFHSQGISSV